MNARIKKSKTPVPTAKKASRGRPATPEEIDAIEKGKPVVETAVEATTTEAAPVEATAKSKKAKATKKTEPQDLKPTPPPDELVVFALRMTLPERQKLHETAGPAKASKFARMILKAAANRDVDQIRDIIEATRPAS